VRALLPSFLSPVPPLGSWLTWEQYHLAQRELSFTRDRVNLKRLDRWSEAKMRSSSWSPTTRAPRRPAWGVGRGRQVALQPLPLCRGLPPAHRGSAAGGPRRPQQRAGGGVPRSGLQASRTPVVYSVGSRDETSFELAMFQLLGVKPLTVDPSLSEDKQAHLKSLEFLEFHNLGLKVHRGGAPSGGGASSCASRRSWDYSITPISTCSKSIAR